MNKCMCISAFLVVALASCAQIRDFTDGIDRGVQAVAKSIPKTKQANQGISHADLLRMGYIVKNPHYPKHSSKPYVWTSRNCRDGHLCFSGPSNMVEERR